MYGLGAAEVGALRLRRNAAEPLQVPEWREGETMSHRDSMAAYAIAGTSGSTITIQASFTCAADDPPNAEIRALPIVAPQPPSWWLEPAVSASPAAISVLYAWYLRFLAAVAAGAAGDALGAVKPGGVTFGMNGTSGFETFELEGSRIAERGVGVHDVTWRWQYRPDAGAPWRDFAESRHRFYAVLDVPKAPWVQADASTDTQLPWTDVLEYACRWATGARTADEAATLVTIAVNALGNGLIEYGCPILAVSQYSMPFFNCTAFLERLRGEIGNGPYVNCSDCATIVATFANALGCDLWQSKMAGLAPFALNPIRAIGSPTWQIACGWGGFNYHEVAWKGACTASEQIFDACLYVDGDANPALAPHTPLLPANIPFGFFGDGLYRDRLASPVGQVNCEPQPSTRQRRSVI